MILATTKSTPTVKPPSKATDTMTTAVEPINSSQVGQVHFFSSSWVSSEVVGQAQKRALAPQDT